MIRFNAFIGLLCLVFLLGCSEAETHSSVNSINSGSMPEPKDPRHAIAMYKLPTLKFSTVRSCYQYMSLGIDEIKSMPGPMGQVFGEHLKDFWQYVVEIGSSTNSKSNYILKDGMFSASTVDPEFKLGGSLTKKAEACGYISGQSFAAAGLMDIADFPELEATYDEVTLDQQQTLGVIIINEATERSYEALKSDAFGCLLNLALSSNREAEMTADELFWNSLVARYVNSESVDIVDIATKNMLYNDFLSNFGDSETITALVDGDVKSNCEAKSQEAVSTIQKEFAE